MAASGGWGSGETEEEGGGGAEEIQCGRQIGKRDEQSHVTLHVPESLLLWRLRQEDLKLELSLGSARPYLKMKTVKRAGDGAQ